MYICNKCGNSFKKPELKSRNMFSVFILTIKAMRNPEITRDDCFIPYCPICGSPDIVTKDESQKKIEE